MKKIFISITILTLSAFGQGFTTNNTNGNLIDACGNNFIMKGMNVPLAWYVSNVNGSISALKTNTKSNCLRIVVETGTADNSWQTCVQNCINNKMIPMVELHDVTGSTDPAALKRMGDFWASKATFLRSANVEKYILINLANEWGTWQTATNKNTVWRDAVIAAIKPIRDAGIKTTIVVDAVGYGQDIDDAYNIRTYAKDIQRADNTSLGGPSNSTEKSNLLFSIHMYCEWRKGGDNVGIVSTIKSSGIPIIVGEFGYQHATDGSCDIDEQLIMNTCQSSNVGWLAWSQKGNGSPVEYLDLCTDWNCTQLSSWGNTVINGTNGTKTAVECTVFNSSGCGTTCATAAPTVTATQSLCQNTTASALTATGTALKWYSVASGGTASTTAPTPNTTTTGTTTYYVSQTLNNCEGPRTSITVTVNTPPAPPTVTSPVNYCQGKTATALSATGTGLKWYGTSATGGTSSTTAPTPSTTNVGTVTYYVSQTINTCESPRAAIVVNTGTPSTAPTVTSPITYCQGATAIALTANGTNLLWYTAQSGGTGSATAPIPSTTNATTTTYYVSQTGNGCESARTTLSVIVNASPATPNVTSPVNYDLDQQATALSATGTNLKWYTSASGGTGSSTAPTPSTSVGGTTTYYVSQTAANGCESPRSSITVNVTNIYKIYRTNTPIIIDGSIETIWNNSSIKPLSLTNTILPTISNPADLSGTFKAIWDNTYIYVLGEITDDTKTNDSPEIYNDDAVEFYIDINNNKATAYGTNDAQYNFGWNDGTTVTANPSGRSISNITYSMVATTNGYIFEARIPWANVQGSPTVGQLLGIEFQVNDDDNGSTRDGKLSWNATTDDAWQNPSLFGTGILSDVLTTQADDFLNNEVSVYPNPFVSEVTIGLIGSFEYKIYNSLGTEIGNGIAADRLSLGQNLHSGIYFLNLYQDHKHKAIKITKK